MTDYERGFAECREMAVKVCEELAKRPTEFYMCHGDEHVRHITPTGCAIAIRSLQPSESGWVAVSERLPERGRHVLIAWRGTSCSLAVAKFGGKRWIDPYDSQTDFTTPTDWQPLPEPPAEHKERP